MSAAHVAQCFEGLNWRLSLPPHGVFICLDGADGAGKTTLTARLCEEITSLGHEVLAVRDPGGTGLGDSLRSLLLDRHAIEIGSRAEMLMFMASRAQLMAERIIPALERGSIVVTDRFLLSTVVYQGIAGGLEPPEIWRVGHAATSGLMPNMTLLLDVSREVARSRMDRHKDRIESRPEAYQTAVREGFRQALTPGEFPAPILRIDADSDPETVFEAVRREVFHVLEKHSRA
jgi:dTMP kinase